MIIQRAFRRHLMQNAAMSLANLMTPSILHELGLDMEDASGNGSAASSENV